MAKARRLITLALRKRLLLPILGTSVAIIGTVSAVFGIVDIHFGVLGTAILATVILALSTFFHFRRLHVPQVAVDDVIAPEGDNYSPMTLQCPCDMKLASEASRLAEDCYSGSITIESSIFEQLRVKNPLILSCLTDQRGHFVGYVDVIPLYEAFAQSLIQGRVTESQVSHEDVLPPQQMKSCRYLFISGIAVRDPETYSGRRSASVLVWTLLKYLDRYYGQSNPLVFALAATPEGNELLQRFKLQPAPGKAVRADRYKLYSITLSQNEITRRFACIPNWDGLCDLPWAEDHGRQKKVRPQRPSLPETKALNLA
jgi:hypothetical protein